MQQLSIFLEDSQFTRYRLNFLSESHILVCIGLTKGGIKTFRNLETTEGTLVHSPALGGLFKDFGDATESAQV